MEIDPDEEDAVEGLEVLSDEVRAWRGAACACTQRG
jgi:hypothetical protein